MPQSRRNVAPSGSTHRETSASYGPVATSPGSSQPPNRRQGTGQLVCYLTRTTHVLTTRSSAARFHPTLSAIDCLIAAGMMDAAAYQCRMIAGRSYEEFAMSDQGSHDTNSFALSRRALLAAASGVGGLAFAGATPARAAVTNPDFSGLPPYGNGTLPAGVRARRIPNINGLTVNILEAGFCAAGPAAGAHAAWVSEPRL